MKRFSLFFAVALVLFSFQGGFAGSNNPRLDSPNQVLAPPVPVKDTINYDSVDIAPYQGEPAYGATNYIVAQRFVPTRSFTLKSLYFQVDNSLVNTDSPCFVRVVPNAGGRPDTNSSPFTVDTVPAPLPSVLWAHRFSDATNQFVANDTFWILLGPVPGGWFIQATPTGQTATFYEPLTPLGFS
jgi:hypothetical protein